MLENNRGLSGGEISDEPRDSKHIKMVAVIGDNLVRLELEAILGAHFLKAEVGIRKVGTRVNPIVSENFSLNFLHLYT